MVGLCACISCVTFGSNPFLTANGQLTFRFLSDIAVAVTASTLKCMSSDKFITMTVTKKYLRTKRRPEGHLYIAYV